MTAGIILLNELFPAEMRFNEGEELKSSLFYDRLSKFAKKYPSKYATAISKIERLGAQMAFSLGASVGIDDLNVDKKKVDKFISGIDKKMSKAKNDSEKEDILIKSLEDATKLSISIPKDDNQLVEQVHSGSRGKPVQFARLAIGPLYSIDMEQKPKPFLIRNSFNDGLTSAEYFNVSSQGRFSSVASANATSEPGALGKDLIAAADTEKITSQDCHTMNGEFESPHSKNILGHFEAGPNGKLIDTKYMSSLKGKQVKVRTPITCEEKVGVCVKCYGLKQNGTLPSIGEEVGIIAGQTVSQIGVQMSLSVKHSVSGKKGGSKLTGNKKLSLIVNAPESYDGYSKMSDVSGIVESINKELSGETEITIGGHKMKIGKDIRPSVKIGDKVSMGDRITKNGELNVRDVVKTRGNVEARRLLSNEIYSTVKESTGIGIDRKHADILARGQISLYQNNKGETVGRSKVTNKYNTKNSKLRLSTDLVGLYLDETVGRFEKGTKISARTISKLRMLGVSEIKVTDVKPTFTPTFKPMTQRSSANSTFEQAMNYRGIKRSFLDNVISTREKDLYSIGDSSRASHSSGIL